MKTFWGRLIVGKSKVRHRWQLHHFNSDYVWTACGQMASKDHINIHSRKPECKRCAGQAMHPEDLPLDHVVDWLAERVREQALIESITDNESVKKALLTDVQVNHDLEFDDWQWRLMAQRVLYQIRKDAWQHAFKQAQEFYGLPDG